MCNTLLSTRGKTVHTMGMTTRTTCVSLSPIVSSQQATLYIQSDNHLVIREVLRQLLAYLSTLKITNLPLLNTFFTPFPQYLLIATTKENL